MSHAVMASSGQGLQVVLGMGRCKEAALCFAVVSKSSPHCFRATYAFDQHLHLAPEVQIHQYREQGEQDRLVGQ